MQTWKSCEHPERPNDHRIEWCRTPCSGCHDRATATRRSLTEDEGRAEMVPLEWSALSRIIERTQPAR